MMKLRKRQLGFLLNPFRFAGTVQSGALTTDGAGVLTVAGTGVAAAAVSADASAVLTVGSDQAASGAMSMDGASTTTMVGAGLAAAAASADGAAVLTAYGEVSGITVDAADFDGTNDYLSRAALTGQAASKKGILSFWLYADALAGSRPFLGHDSVNGSVFQFTDSIDVRGFSATPTEVLRSTRNAGATGSWQHWLISYDLALGASGTHMYLNDVSQTPFPRTETDANIDLGAVDTWTVGADNVGNLKYDGGLAEFYYAPGQWLDFSVEANRRKFRTSAGKPASLGATGSSPTGTDPLIYLHLDDGETANNFAINRAGTGNFTVTGSLTTHASSPSD